MVGGGGETGSMTSAVKQAFLELAKAETSGDYERALKACNRILRNHAKETIAFRCKLICLIHLSKFDEALLLIKKTPPSHMGECTFEKAYIEYRLNENEKALETLNKAGSEELRCLELKAQILYRLEKFTECHAIYRKLAKDHSDSYDEERRTNLLAVEAQLQALGEDQKGRVESLHTYEQYYNKACQLIECGNFSEAMKRLEKSEKMCRESLNEEGVGEEETEDEVAGIRVQRAFVLLTLGQIDTALNICHEILKNKPSDVGVLSTASNNCIASRRDVNLSDARKRLKVALQTPENKLSLSQRRVLATNQSLLHLAGNQRDLTRKGAEELREKFSMNEMAALIIAATALRARETNVAIAALREVTGSPTILMSLLHVYITSDKFTDALAVINEFPVELRDKPAVRSIEIALLEATGQHRPALTALRSAIQNANDKTVRSRLLDQCASLCAKMRDDKGELDCLQQLNQLEPNNVAITARLIKAFSSVDVGKAHALSRQALPVIDTSSINVDELENSDWILYGERYRSKKEAKKEVERADTEVVTGKLRHRKRKRKLQLPKNCDLKQMPDPERWLPRQERAAYRKHRGKKLRDKEIGRGTQGAVASPHLETSNKVESSPKPAAPTPTEGPRQQRPGGAAPPKKKKPVKKGGKW